MAFPQSIPSSFIESGVMSITTAVTVAQGVGTAIVTILVLFVILMGIGFAILVRRRRFVGTASSSTPTGIASDPRGFTDLANIALVRLDDAVTQNRDELGFAIAQFGDEKTASFANALGQARSTLVEAFRLKQQLDDSIPDSPMQQREWNGRIISLSDEAQTGLNEEAERFTALRREQTDAPTALKAVRLIIVSTSMRVPAATALVTKLGETYSPSAVAPVRTNVGDARELLKTAGERVGAAESSLADPVTTDVASITRDADTAARRAARLLDAVDSLAASLASDAARLLQLADRSRGDLVEARSARDESTDPGGGAAIGSAITGVEDALFGADSMDPATSIAQIEQEVVHLDRALAVARNQQQRLDHAQTALLGVLLSARSQIMATHHFIDARRDGVGADARTRLAEAERLLIVAEADADPVSALDTARSSATYARDADALARFDLLR